MRRKLERWPCPWNKGKTCDLVKSMKVYKEEMTENDYIYLIGGHREPGHVQGIREKEVSRYFHEKGKVGNKEKLSFPPG